MNPTPPFPPSPAPSGRPSRSLPTSPHSPPLPSVLVPCLTLLVLLPGAHAVGLIQFLIRPPTLDASVVETSTSLILHSRCWRNLTDGVLPPRRSPSPLPSSVSLRGGVWFAVRRRRCDASHTAANGTHQCCCVSNLLFRVPSPHSPPSLPDGKVEGGGEAE